jgi:hypothetical protein
MLAIIMNCRETGFSDNFEQGPSIIRPPAAAEEQPAPRPDAFDKQKRASRQQ